MHAPIKPPGILAKSEADRIGPPRKKPPEVLSFSFAGSKARSFQTLVIYRPRRASRGGGPRWWGA